MHVLISLTQMLVVDDRNAIRACDQISELVDALSTFLNPNCLQQYFLPQYLTRPVRSVVTGQYFCIFSRSGSEWCNITLCSDSHSLLVVLVLSVIVILLVVLVLSIIVTCSKCIKSTLSLELVKKNVLDTSWNHKMSHFSW